MNKADRKLLADGLAEIRTDLKFIRDNMQTKGSGANPFGKAGKVNLNPPPLPPKPAEPPKPDLPYSWDAARIKDCIVEGRPLGAEWEKFMEDYPEYFSEQEKKDALKWYGAVGGDWEWLQLGIGWYRDPYGPIGPTPIPPGGFNPYQYSSSADIYAGYKGWLSRGGKHPAMPEKK